MSQEPITGEPLDLGNLPRVSQILKSRLEQLDKFDGAHRARHYNLTQRLFDEARPAGVRTYIHAHQLIGTAAENFEAVFTLIRGQGATPFAPHNLIRPAFESAFYALWILDPDDGKTRCLRGLRVAVEDSRQQLNWTNELLKIPGLTDAERQSMLNPITRASNVYRQEATQLNVAWSRVAQRLNVEQEIPKLSHVAAAEPLIRHSMVAGWKQLSGYQHGHVYAVVSGAERSTELKIPGGVVARMTLRDEHFALAMQMAGLIQLWAIDAFVRRTTAGT